MIIPRAGGADPLGFFPALSVLDRATGLSRLGPRVNGPQRNDKPWSGPRGPRARGRIIPCRRRP